MVAEEAGLRVVRHEVFMLRLVWVGVAYLDASTGSARMEVGERIGRIEEGEVTSLTLPRQPQKASIHAGLRGAGVGQCSSQVTHPGRGCYQRVIRFPLISAAEPEAKRSCDGLGRRFRHAHPANAGAICTCEEVWARAVSKVQQFAVWGTTLKKTLIALIGGALMTVAGFAVGHSGGTDSNGCHTNHKTGEYHCHNPK